MLGAALTTIAIALLGLWLRSGPPKPLASVATIGGRGLKIEGARLADYFGIAIDGDDRIFVTEGTGNSLVEFHRDGTERLVTSELDMPSAVAAAKDGWLIVANTGAHTIVRVNADTGRVETLAGAPGASGFADGRAAEARFNGPIGLAIGADGRIFVADTYNDRIREIGRDGTVRTIAGGAQGDRDGAGPDAQFDTPCGITVEPGGSLLVADTGNHRIRRIGPDGAVTTAAGVGERFQRDGAPTASAFDEPTAIALRRDGALFIADAGNAAVRMVAPPKPNEAPVVSTVAGGFPPGLADTTLGEARLNRPTGLAFDSKDTLFFTDRGNGLLRALLPAGRTLGTRSAPESALLRPEDIRQAIPPRWPYEPPDARRDIAGTFGEIRGMQSPDRDAWFHNGLDIPGAYGEAARAILTERVTHPLPIEDPGTLRERMRLPLIGYTHIRFGRDAGDAPLDTLPPGAIAFRRDAQGQVIGVRVRRGTQFKAGETLGTLNRMNHVHLIAGPVGVEVNALTALRFPGLIDTTPPTIEGVTVTSDRRETLYDSSRGDASIPARGRLRVIVRAFDQVDGNPTYRRLGLYRLGYQLLTQSGGSVTEPRYTIVFERLPSTPHAISLTYADGSRSGYDGGTTFGYIVTNEVRDGQAREGFLDTDALAPGTYTLRLLAEDYFGNQARRDLLLVK